MGREYNTLTGEIMLIQDTGSYICLTKMLKLLESCYYAQKMKIINKLNLWFRYYNGYYPPLYIYQLSSQESIN
jgi:hypothetical protein